MSDRRRSPRTRRSPSGRWWGESDRAVPLVLAALVTSLSLFGGILDREWLGLGDQYGGSGRPASLTLVEHSARYSNWFTQYAMLARHAPGSTILLDPDSATGMSASDLFAIGDAAAVRQVAVDVARPADEPFASAGRGDRRWTLWLDEPGRPTTLAIRAVTLPDGTTQTLIVEVTEWESPLLVERDTLPVRIAALTSLSGLPEPLLEGALYVILTLIGGLIVPRRPPLPRSARPALALIAGLALIGLMGVLRLPGLVPLAVALGFAVLGTRYVGREHGAWHRADVVPLAAFLSLIVTVVAVTHASGSVLVSFDSFSYLGQGHELAAGRLGPGALDLKRGAFLQGLYGLGFAAGIDILAAPGLVLLASATILLVCLGWSSTRDLPVRLVVVGLALLPWFHLQAVSFARYANSHAVLAVALLALALVMHWTWRTEQGVQKAYLPLIGLLSSAPVVMRPEGVLLVGLLLLGASLVRGGAFPAAWRAAGTTAAVWGLVLFVESVVVGQEPSRLLVAFVVTGILMIVVPFLRGRLGRFWSVVPTLTAVALWGGALLLTVGANARAGGFLEAAIINLGEGQGRWGLLAPVLLLLAVLGVAIRHTDTEGPSVAAMRFLLIGFIPVNLLAKLGDGVFGSNGSILDLLLDSRGGGRVGWGDSVNRMWMHAVLIVVALAVIRLAGLLDDRRRHRGSALIGPLGRARSGARTVTFALLAVWVASMWSPFYVEADRPPTFQRTEAWDFEIVGDRPGPVLVEGVVVQQAVYVPPEAVPGAASANTSLCSVVPFVTYARENRGWIEVELAIGIRSETFTLRQQELEDWSSETFCIHDIRRDDLQEGLMRVRIRGGGVREHDAAAATLVSGSEAFAGSVASQSLALRLAVVESSASSEWRPLGSPFLTTTAPNVLPAALAVLVVLILTFRSQGSAAAPPHENSVRSRDGGSLHDRARASIRIGSGLALAGMLVLTVGLHPHGANRDFVALDPPHLGRAPDSGLLLRHGASVEQAIDPSLLPQPDEIGRDALFRNERVCIEIPAVLVGGEADSAPAQRDLTVTLSSGSRDGAPSGRWFLDAELMSSIESESATILACFGVAVERLREVDDLRLTVRADTLPGEEALELGSRAPRSSVVPAMTFDVDGMTTSSRILDVRFLRETPSGRERALSAFGWGSMLAGGLFTGGARLAARLRMQKFHRSAKD